MTGSSELGRRALGAALEVAGRHDLPRMARERPDWRERAGGLLAWCRGRA